MTLDSAVRLGLPAEGRYTRVARGVAVACASLEDFDVDDLVDVRLLADEVFLAVVALGRETVEVQLRPSRRSLVMSARSPYGGTRTWSDPDLELPRLVFDVVCVEATYGIDDGQVWFDGRIEAMDR